mmetsp:Transcript_2806/g.7865  ORF Transcript_2806/g.7865 Transcript_2806/m.7865 type:complete len:217 (-) Transcript_2806:144-794(-)
MTLELRTWTEWTIWRARKSLMSVVGHPPLTDWAMWRTSAPVRATRPTLIWSLPMETWPTTWPCACSATVREMPFSSMPNRRRNTCSAPTEPFGIVRCGKGLARNTPTFRVVSSTTSSTVPPWYWPTRGPESVTSWLRAWGHSWQRRNTPTSVSSTILLGIAMPTNSSRLVATTFRLTPCQPTNRQATVRTDIVHVITGLRLVESQASVFPQPCWEH